MKTNLKLKSSTPLQALEAKAIKASAIALSKTQNAKDKKKNVKRKPLSPIERDLRNLQCAVEGWKLEGCKVKFERGKGATSACATIGIFKPAEAKFPYRSFVFYPDPLIPSRLGSVAVYGPDARDTAEAINRAGLIFGHKILQVKIEFGRRPFVDVKFSKF